MTTPRVTVPVEPTEAMKIAGVHAIDNVQPNDVSMWVTACWSAMLSAAHAPEGGVVEELREALIQADLKIRSLPGTDQSDVEFIRAALATREEAPAEAGDDEWSALWKLADAASAGSWGVEDPMDPCLTIVANPEAPVYDWKWVATCDWPDEDNQLVTAREVKANAAFIAAANPAAIKRLIAALRAQPPAREDEQPVAKPAPFDQGGIGHAMYQAFHAYHADYVLSTDGADYEPTPFERGLIEDFFAGLMAEEAFFGPVRALYDTHPAPDALRVAVSDIAAERQRQVDVEGWSEAHDDEHDAYQMARAAGCYAFHASRDDDDDDDDVGMFVSLATRHGWPWDRAWWKPKSRRADLVRAGALIVAEIERLDRAALQAEQKGGA